MIGLQTDYFLVLWEHWDDWSNEFVRWSYKKGYPRDRVINELLLSENWNTRETIFDPDRFLWEVYHGLVTDAIKVTGKELNRLAEQFFKGSAENISFLELLDKIACEYVLTYKQQGCGIFYQDEKNDVAVIHTFGIDLDFETFGGNSPDWAGVVTLLAFPARDLFKRCPIEENINLIYRYITDPENAHTENRIQGRLNGLRKRLKIAAEYEKLLEPNKAASTSCQLVTDIQHERQQEAEPSKGEDVRAHYQQTAKALISKTVKPLLKHIKDKDYFKTARELRITNISATKKQNGLRFDGDEVSFTDADGVTYGYFIGGSCKVESGCCWVQMAPGQTNYILNGAKYKDFYDDLKQIAQKVKELS